MVRSICTVDGCETMNDARGYCPSHYNRWKRYGDPLGAPPVRPDRGCAVDGCERPHRNWGYCNLHCQRFYKHGDPLRVIEVSRKPCKMAGCEALAKGHGYCTKHLARIRNTGDPNKVRDGGRPPKGEHPGWGAIHKRLSRDKGKAARYACVDCGQRAGEWSYDNSDPNELIDARTKLAYSLAQERYAPRCVKCHRIFDLTFKKQPPSIVYRPKAEGLACMVLTVTDIGENE